MDGTLLLVPSLLNRFHLLVRPRLIINFTRFLPFERIETTVYSGVGRFLIRTPQFWSCIALTLVIYAGPVLTFRLWKNITKPNDSEKVNISLIICGLSILLMMTVF